MWLGSKMAGEMIVEKEGRVVAEVNRPQRKRKILNGGFVYDGGGVDVIYGRARVPPCMDAEKCSGWQAAEGQWKFLPGGGQGGVRVHHPEDEMTPRDSL